MTDYDPNLPQAFAHEQKRRGPGLIMIIFAVVAVFVLAMLFGTLRKPTPTAVTSPAPQEAATTGDGAVSPATSTQEAPAGGTDADGN